MTALAKSSSFILLAAVLLSGPASAQTAVNIAVSSGNGQLSCSACTILSPAYTPLRVFEPLVVLVTDSQGNPVPTTTVNWNILAGGGPGVTLSSLQTLTGANGTTSTVLSVAPSSVRNTYIVSATLLSGSSVSFTLTAGASESSLEYAYITVPSGLPLTISGNAGGAGSPSIGVKAQDLSGQPIPGISVRLASPPTNSGTATVACATGTGADPGSTLTDNTGTATCTPVFGPQPGTGTYYILVGGVANGTLNGQGTLVGYAALQSVSLQVAAAPPGSMKTISGDMQSGNPGQALPIPLVAEVDTAAGAAYPGQTVTWSVTPSGAAQLSSTATTSDANGRVSNNVTLAGSASGTVQVTAAVSNSVSVSFTVNVIAPVNGLVKLSGDSQTAPVGTSFANPLRVQVSVAAGQSAAGIPVSFAVTPSGSATLSANSVSTDSNGIAQVTVTAGATAGAITVSASVGNSSVSFNLTATPPGPQISANSFVNGAGFYLTDATHSALTPCGIGTVIAPGIAPGIQGVVTSSMFGPLPYQLAQVSISFNNSQAPVYNVANIGGKQQAAFQVPCDVTPSSSVPATVKVNGASATVQVAVRSAGPGIFQFPDSDGLQRAVIIRSDGSFSSANNPVKRGETVRLYITGMGQVQPALATNSLPAPGVDSLATGTVVVAVNNFGERVVTARRAPELVGVDEIAFQVDPNTTVGTVPLFVWIFPADNSGIEISNSSWISVQ